MAFIGFLFLHAPLRAQYIPDSFKKLTDSVLDVVPETYDALDDYFKPYRQDTVLMYYLSDQALLYNYPAGQCYAMNQLGTRFRNLSEYPKAINLHEKALALAKNANNMEFEIYSLNMLGVVYRRKDAIKTALDYNQEALALAETIPNPSPGIKRSINVAYNSIGNIYQVLEQYDLAIEQFKKSLVLEKELGNNLGLAINNQNIGECLEAQGKLEEALERYRIALAYDQEIASKVGVLICSNSIAKIYIKQGKPQEALNILESLVEPAKQEGDWNVTTPILNNLGWALTQLGRYDEAEGRLVEGLQMGLKYHYLSFVSDSYGLLAELDSIQGDYRDALSNYRLSKSFNDKVTNELNLRYVNDMIIKYEADKKSNEIQVLAQENEIVKLKLRKNRTTLLISSLAVVLLAGILYILYRQFQLKSEKKVLTLEQSMLRSQMNPHFLFNSLNSIKLYIINNETKNAVHYLNKFSKLVRKILDASSMKEISLADELETVELYMNIENIRFSNEIDFSIRIDEGIDPHNIKIPSLILQPFLENSLWHGLSSKEGEKKISIQISRKNQWFITIAIIDNGVGREMAERIKKSKVLKRKSLGINITKERLANFSKDYQNSFDVELLDLYDANGKPTGTKVVLQIPTI